MLHLYLLILILYTAYGNNDIEQIHPSQTKTGGKFLKVRIECSAKEGSNLFWYSQKPNEAFKRIISVVGEKTVFDEELLHEKFSTHVVQMKGKNNVKYQLDIHNITHEDAANYFCAKGASLRIPHQVFSSGTKLIVTNESQSVKPPTAFILKPSKEDVDRTGEVIYVCSLQNFFPDVIQVIWNEEGNEQELEAEQGDIIFDATTQTYSVNSWIVVKKSNLKKTFICNYKHEGINSSQSWAKATTNNLEYREENNWYRRCFYKYKSRGVVLVRPFSYRAAYLSYCILLVKIILYWPAMLFFKYKMRQ
ncbi:immunoglobulin kappa light chain-like [Aquarana catesbeiana]|uniref:immunoglobulin kappa light chain-like n=1 Tax=Aquarana catesbeiana TaxID=8400 RepID=UPI003CCA2B25